MKKGYDKADDKKLPKKGKKMVKKGYQFGKKVVDGAKEELAEKIPKKK